MMLIDTHAHLHFADSYGDDLPRVLENSRANGVSKVITVGTDAATSQAALELAANPAYATAKTGVQIFTTIGLHPHNAGPEATEKIVELARQNSTGHPEQRSPAHFSGSTDSGSESGMTNEREFIASEPGMTDKKPVIVAIGECGLDYYRDNSPHDEQIAALEAQIELAEELDLALIFHVRDAFDDFFEILSGYANIRGVVHSFTGGPEQVEKINALGLHFGLNGIMTFTRDQVQLEAAKMIPVDKLLLETDCPYLAPNPLRGKRNEPANIALIAKFLAELRGEKLMDLAEQTTVNAEQLFSI